MQLQKLPFNEPTEEKGSILHNRYLSNTTRIFFYILGNCNIQNIYCISVFRGFRLTKLLPIVSTTHSYDLYRMGFVLLFPFLTIVVQLTLILIMSSHETFRIKWFLAKKQKQDHPIPQWIQMKTSNKIRFNSERRHWRRIKLGAYGIVLEMAHICLLYQGHQPLTTWCWNHHSYLNSRTCFTGKIIFLLFLRFHTSRLVQ